MIDDLKMIKMQMEILEKNYKNNLERRLTSLIKSLEIELLQLKENPHYRPNSCGIISEANNIDELCIKLKTLQEYCCKKAKKKKEREIKNK